MVKKSLSRLTTRELAKIKTLAASGMSYRGISRETGNDRKTVAAACRRPGMATQIERVKIALADRFENIAVRMLTSVTIHDIKKINAYQRVLSSAVAVDKSRLLRGESTQNLAICEIIEAVERDGMSTKPAPPTAS